MHNERIKAISMRYLSRLLLNSVGTFGKYFFVGYTLYTMHLSHLSMLLAGEMKYFVHRLS